MIFTVQIKRASARLTLCTDSKFWWASRESNTAPTDYETHHPADHAATEDRTTPKLAPGAINTGKLAAWAAR